MTILAALIGLPTDVAKDADDLMRMVVLGATTFVNWPDRAMHTHVEDAKADQWKAFLAELLESGKCCPQDAAFMAGRLSFSVTLAANRVRRAFLKHF